MTRSILFVLTLSVALTAGFSTAAFAADQTAAKKTVAAAPADAAAQPAVSDCEAMMAKMKDMQKNGMKDMKDMPMAGQQGQCQPKDGKAKDAMPMMQMPGDQMQNMSDMPMPQKTK